MISRLGELDVAARTRDSKGKRTVRSRSYAAEWEKDTAIAERK